MRNTSFLLLLTGVTTAILTDLIPKATDNEPDVVAIVASEGVARTDCLPDHGSCPPAVAMPISSVDAFFGELANLR